MFVVLLVKKTSEEPDIPGKTMRTLLLVSYLVSFSMSYKHGVKIVVQIGAHVTLEAYH